MSQAKSYKSMEAWQYRTYDRRFTIDDFVGTFGYCAVIPKGKGGRAIS
jgi:hypothetical protein